ncbi:glycosyltransferase family 2 protein [Zunongwangia sp. H14]|uniref:glycosyltransferase family 2 protein n=1 Tax=Zunongwangia sp. H14 TaxID=3240792 RepID=UPI003568EBEC
MILLIHKKGKKLLHVLKEGQELELAASGLVDAFWKVAQRFPEEVVGWCGEEFHDQVSADEWNSIFYHQRIMASYAVRNIYISEDIGYIDQLPFININRAVRFPSWRMSTDVGGIYGKALLCFKELFNGIEDFGYLLNSIAKLGQQNSLFCYSEPALTTIKSVNSPVCTTSDKELYKFISQHYNSIWIYVLLFCHLWYEKRFPLLAFLKALNKPKFFRQNIALEKISISAGENSASKEIDVIIPTIGRKEHLFNVLKDLEEQVLLPKKVIVVEQNPEEHATSELNFLEGREWPFQIIHHFTHQTGACNARNIALKEVKSDWIFFADDDIRLEPELLKKSLKELQRLNISCLNINCRQEGEETVFSKIKQWGSFGSGTSIVKTCFAEKCRFPLLYEQAYGEDSDFGMQLRNLGCDIIYHPDLAILHLKAKVGGLRTKVKKEWEAQEPLPKPSPTVMAFALKYNTPEQIKGFKTSLLLKFYRNQEIKNPFTYIRSMNLRWKKSKEWAHQILQEK